MKSQTKQLNELCTIAKGKKVTITSEKTKNSIPYLLINTLRGKEPKFFTEDEKYTEAIPEDVLIVADGANSGLVGTGVKGAVGSTILRIRINVNDLDKDYLSYFLKSNFAKMNKDLKGTGIPHLKSKEMMEMRIRKPELKEQHTIVSAIETQFTRLDNTIENLKSVKKKLEVYRGAVLKKAFEKGDGWEESIIGKQVKVKYGKGLPKRDRIDNGKIPVYGSSGKVGNHNKSLINFNTIIVARKGSVGNNFLVKEPSWPIDTTYYLEDIKIDQDYLYHFLNSSIFKDSSTAIPGLRREDLEAIKISFPKSPSLQTQITSHIEQKFSIINKTEQIINQSLFKTERLKKSILKIAFEGRLVKE